MNRKEQLLKEYNDSFKVNADYNICLTKKVS